MLKTAFDKLLKKIDNGAVAVTYPDGERVVYGEGKPYFEAVIKHPRVFLRMARNLSLGFGESYMDGSLEIKGRLDQVARLTSMNEHLFENLRKYLPQARLNRNTAGRQRKLVSHHYDLGNSFYKLWLDKSLTYSCAYFKSKKNSLEQAQENKLDHTLKKLQLRRGMRVLDIGSGWGALLIKAAKEYGVTGLGVTLSEKQYRLSNKKAKELGLSNKISFKLTNYANLAKKKEKFDRIVSIGMFEHVGKRNHRSYFEANNKLLKDGGICLLHTISHQSRERPSDPWIDKYIFPGGYIPSVREIVSLLPDYGFKLIDYENLKMHYALTLDEWWRAFERNKAKVIKMYDERFYRMWRLYLASSSASFRYGNLDLSQFTFTKGSAPKAPLTREYLYR